MMKCAEYLLFFAVVAALAAPVHAQEQAAAPAAKASGNDQPIEISSSQLAAFRQLYSMNARPVQPLNGRIIKASQ